MEAMRRLACVVLPLAMVLLAVADGNGSPSEHGAGGLTLVEVTQSHMGMPVHLRVYAPDEETGRRVCRAAFERIAELNLILSDYEPESELSQLVRRAGAGPVRVSDDLFNVLSASLRIAQETDGLLDPTAAPVVRLWRQARAEGRPPDQNRIQQALATVGYRRLVLNDRDQTAQLRLPGMRLDLGAIAKGYVGDEALKTLRAHGITRAMFEAGGDMVFGDPPPGQTGWLVRPGIDGLPELRLANTAAAISGDTVQFMVIDGQRFGHIIDPRTGQPVQNHQACLVTAPTGLTADPLATLGTIMQDHALQELITEHYPDAAARVVRLTQHPDTSRSEPAP
jgi:thiamine biosynthesis lipoprotein